MTTPNYTPPSSSRIARNQDSDDALRLLIAQRRLYSRAKGWQNLRWIGLLLIGVAAPVVSVLWPSAAVTVGAVSGVWLFLGRTLLAWLQSQLVTRAASIQEACDFHIFGMPRTAQRSTFPSLEDIASLAGPDRALRATAAKEELLDWYPIKDTTTGEVTVAVAQRSNASYSDRLYRQMSRIWTSVAVVWVIGLIVVSCVVGLSLETFLLGVALPVLPAVLDVYEYVTAIFRAAAERGDLARSIAGRLDETGQPIRSEELLVWQERIFELRTTPIQVPDWLYGWLRRRNEASMHAAADQLTRADGAAEQ